MICGCWGEGEGEGDGGARGGAGRTAGGGGATGTGCGAGTKSGGGGKAASSPNDGMPWNSTCLRARRPPLAAPAEALSAMRACFGCISWCGCLLLHGVRAPAPSACCTCAASAYSPVAMLNNISRCSKG